MSTHSSGYYSIDTDYNIIGFNDVARQIYPSLVRGQKCYKALMNLDAPCPVCPVANGIYGPKTYLDPIRHIYETVDAVEIVLADGSKGHALVFSTVAEGEKLASAIPTGEESLRTFGAINLIGRKYSVLFDVNIHSQKISVFRAESLSGGTKPDLADNMDYNEAMNSLISQYIHPEEREYLRGRLTLEKVRKQLDEAAYFSVHCRILTDKVHYYKLQFVRNGEADSYEGFVAAMACEDDDVNARQIYERQLATLLSSLSHTKGYAHLDITDNKVLKMEGSPAFMNAFGRCSSIDEIVQSMSMYILSEKEQQEFLCAYSPEAIKKAYDLGKVEIVRESRYDYETRSARWSSSALRMFMNPGNNHLEGVFYGEDVTREREIFKIQEGIVQAMTNNYFDAFLLDIREKTATMLKHDDGSSMRLMENSKVFQYEEMIERFVSSYVHPDDQAMMREVLKLDNVLDVLSRENEYAHNYRVIYKGEDHYFQSRFVKNEEYGIVVLGSINVDDIIAEKVEHEKELRKALEEANRANDEKSRFLARMSHDMRTPLNGIVGLLELAQKHADDIEYLKENRKKTGVVTDHLISLINDVLDMAKIEDGSIVLANEPFCICEKCSEAMTLIAPQAQEKGITVTVNFTPQEERLTYLYGSPLHLCRAMMNILGNCVKYNRDNGRVSLDIQIVDYDEHTATYRWTIKDTGIGMTQEFLKHIFDPFVQASTDARSIYQGTGLGMSIAKGLIEQMGGTLEVSSELNVGSTFVVTMTFELADKSEIVQEEISDVASIRGMRILLAEDNGLNREIAETILCDEGAVVTSVCNGREAVEAVSGNPPETFDLVLMDIMMPVMDGYEATRQIRQIGRPDTEVIPIIAMTAKAFSEDIQMSLDAGMNAHISKPLDIPKMIRTIAQYRK